MLRCGQQLAPRFFAGARGRPSPRSTGRAAFASARSLCGQALASPGLPSREKTLRASALHSAARVARAFGRLVQRGAKRGKGRCVRSGRGGFAPSGERRTDAVRRTRREDRAGRGAGIAATKTCSEIRGCGRGERTPGERERGRRRAASAKARRDEHRQESPDAAEFGVGPTARRAERARVRRVGQECGLRLT